MLRLFSPILLVALIGCGDSGTYLLSWRVPSPTEPAQFVPVVAAVQCSGLGIDTVRAVAGTDAAESVTAEFPCFGGQPPTGGMGPDLPAGRINLSVYGISASGAAVIGPIMVSAEIPAEGSVDVVAELAQPTACLDGIDNDSDGLPDLLDPQCSNADDSSEQ